MPLPYDKYRDIYPVPDGVNGSSKDNIFYSRMAMGAHHQQVGFEILYFASFWISETQLGIRVVAPILNIGFIIVELLFVQVCFKVVGLVTEQNGTRCFHTMNDQELAFRMAQCKRVSNNIGIDPAKIYRDGNT